MEEPLRCSACEATLKVTAEWCGQCLQKIPAAEEQLQTFAPPDAFIGPRTKWSYSRVAKTDITFGWTGRIAATLLFCVLPLMYLLTYAFPFGLIYLIAACPTLLSGIWKKTPVRAEDSRELSAP